MNSILFSLCFWRYCLYLPKHFLALPQRFCAKNDGPCEYRISSTLLLRVAICPYVWKWVGRGVIYWKVVTSSIYCVFQYLAPPSDGLRNTCQGAIRQTWRNVYVRKFNFDISITTDSQLKHCLEVLVSPVHVCLKWMNLFALDVTLACLWTFTILPW